MHFGRSEVKIALHRTRLGTAWGEQQSCCIHGHFHGLHAQKHDEAMSEKPAITIRSKPVREKLDPVGLWAFESRHGDSFTMDFTRHQFLKLLLITQGSGAVQGDWGEPVCKTGDLVVVPAGLRHRVIDHPRQPISLYGLGIAGKLLRCVPEAGLSLPSGVLRADQLGPLRLEQRMRRLLYAHAQSEPVYRLAAVAAALDLVAQAALAPVSSAHRPLAPSHGEPLGEWSSEPAQASHDPPDPMLESYLAWLQHSFFEPQTLDDAARACGMSRRGFTAAFRLRTGRTWLEYRNRLRAQHAIELLRSTDRKMASIAFQSGFDDLSTFYRVIHRVAGLRPGQLRR